jgi:hypothetical protein
MSKRSYVDIVYGGDAPRSRTTFSLRVDMQFVTSQDLETCVFIPDDKSRPLQWSIGVSIYLQCIQTSHHLLSTTELLGFIHKSLPRHSFSHRKLLAAFLRLPLPLRPFPLLVPGLPVSADAPRQVGRQVHPDDSRSTGL